MKDVIIAPTHGYYRDQAQKELNDTIKDQTDAINLHERIGNIIPNSIYNKIPRNMTNKRYHDLRAIHLGNARADQNARNHFAEEEKLKRTNGVAYPDMGPDLNTCHIKLESGDCMQQNG